MMAERHGVVMQRRGARGEARVVQEGIDLQGSDGRCLTCAERLPKQPQSGTVEADGRRRAMGAAPGDEGHGPPPAGQMNATGTISLLLYGRGLGFEPGGGVRRIARCPAAGGLQSTPMQRGQRGAGEVETPERLRERLRPSP